MDDHELLREFATNHSESAFAGLVARHINHVYTTAVRLVGDHAQAQDVVQAVFITLARQAGALQHSRALGGWLYRVTCNCAKDALRAEQRRRRRETEAMRIAELDETAPAWEAVAPLLDEALHKLKSGEQNAVVLRFFEGKSLRETGAELGLSEDAAQKRIARALEKMRAHFAREGVTVAVAALSAVMATNTCQAAPTGLAARVKGPSLAEASGVGVGSIFGEILFMSTKIKVLVTFIVVALCIALIGIKLERSQEISHLPIAHGNVTIAENALSFHADKSPAVAMPQMAAVPAKAEEIVDPQADLKTAIPELARQIRAGMGLFNFTPPDILAFEFAPGEWQKMQEDNMHWLKDPESENARKSNDETAAFYESLESQTPTFNATGDEATYKVPDGRQFLTFIKIAGRWYIKQNYATDDPNIITNDQEPTPSSPNSTDGSTTYDPFMSLPPAP